MERLPDHPRTSTAIEIRYEPGLSSIPLSAVARQTGISGIVPKSY